MACGEGLFLLLSSVAFHAPYCVKEFIFSLASVNCDS